MKITIIGAGRVGSSIAQRVSEWNLTNELVLLDIDADRAKGSSLDIHHSSAIEENKCIIHGTDDYKKSSGSDINVICAGVPRKGDMSRLDLLKQNASIVSEIALEVEKYSPKSKLVVITNPMDIMVWVVWRKTDFGREDIMGMGGILDTGRYKSLISNELDVCPSNVEGMVIGPHSDLMVPLISKTRIAGKPISNIIPQEKIKEIISKTIDSGKNIINYLGDGGTKHGPSAAAFKLIKTIATNRKKILPVSTILQGEYGGKDLAIGVPAKVGNSGIEKIYEVDMSENEKKKLKDSITFTREKIKKLEKMDL